MSARSLADKLDCATAPAVIASDDAPTMSTSIAGRSNGLRNIAMTTLNPRTWETARFGRSNLIRFAIPQIGWNLRSEFAVGNVNTHSNYEELVICCDPCHTKNVLTVREWIQAA